MIKHIYYNKHHFSIHHRETHDDKEAITSIFYDLQYNMPYGAHEEECSKEYHSILAEGKKPLVVDCGANIGVSTLWFKQRYPDAFIIAIEPAESNYELLLMNCNTDNILCIHAGIGAINCLGWINDTPSEGMQCRTTLDTTDKNVQIHSLPLILSLVPDYIPFVLKVDIEGSEKELFSAHHTLLDAFKFIILEPHDWKFPGKQTAIPFFDFHVKMKRDFVMNHENIGSIRMNLT
jgi:FkbM family methyltransferase